MTMTYLWTGMILISVVFSLLEGTTQAVASASLEGATTAVELCLSMTGAICLWSGMMEVLRQCGLSAKLARCMEPLLKRLYPETKTDQKTLEHISANVSANLLGLGNAATPLGLKAAQGLAQHSREKNSATPSLCMLVVCNTASIQLLPTTVASLRSATGSENPLDILPAVWLASFSSVCFGIFLCKLLQHLYEKKEQKENTEQKI